MEPIFLIVDVRPNKYIILTSTKDRNEAFTLLEKHFDSNPYLEYEIHRQVYPYIDYEVVTNKKLLNFEEWISTYIKDVLEKENITYNAELIVNNLSLLKIIWNAAQKNKA